MPPPFIMGAMPMLRVWGRHTSINVQKVLWCCAELGLTPERIDVGGAFGGLDEPGYRRINPNGRIPTIEDDGFALWEANTILRYLAGKHDMGGLCPTGLAERADAERWMDWQLCHVLPGMITLFFGLIRTPAEQRDNSAIETARQRTEEAFGILDRHLSGRQYVSTDRFTMADIPLGAFAYRWLALPIERPQLANLAAWYERLKERTAYRQHVMLPLS
jgi:glutathione S-transferase